MLYGVFFGTGQFYMKAKLLAVTAAVGLATLVTGCAPDINAMDYNSSQAGQAAQTVPGTVIQAMPVKVSGDNNGGMGLGTLAGAAAGAIGGSVLGGGTRMNLLGGLGGALIGGAVGNYAQNKLTQQVGMQYQVRLKNGQVVSVTQGMNPRYNVGDRVFVILGGKARIIPNTSA